MKKQWIIALLFMVAFATMGVSGCDGTPTADDRDQSAQEKLLAEGQRQAGLPDIKNFTMKKNLRMIEELCDDPNLINYAYLQSEYTGKLIYIGKCIGYGIPVAAQYTNPQKLEYHSSGGWVTLSQADPNGLFMPGAAEGTWLIMVNPADNQPKVCYFEPKVVVSPFQLTAAQ